jgi:hypothetical protein
MPELTVFLNVFFRNEDTIAGYYRSVRNSIPPHRPVFLVNNVSDKYSITALAEIGEVVYVDDVLRDHSLLGVDPFMVSGNARYVRHFFAGVAFCETKFFSFFDPDNSCKDNGWMGKAVEFLASEKSIAAVSPYWEKEGGTRKSFIDTGFSDQFFVGVASRFKEFDYSADTLFSWKYPLRQNGPTFESAVFSNMYKRKLRRLVLCEYLYSHANEGQSYRKRDLYIGMKRFLARAMWNARAMVLRDRSYESIG